MLQDQPIRSVFAALPTITMNARVSPDELRRRARHAVPGAPYYSSTVYGHTLSPFSAVFTSVGRACGDEPLVFTDLTNLRNEDIKGLRLLGASLVPYSATQRGPVSIAVVVDGPTTLHNNGAETIFFGDDVFAVIDKPLRTTTDYAHHRGATLMSFPTRGKPAWYLGRAMSTAAPGQAVHIFIKVTGETPFASPKGAKRMQAEDESAEDDSSPTNTDDTGDKSKPAGKRRQSQRPGDTRVGGTGEDDEAVDLGPDGAGFEQPTGGPKSRDPLSTETGDGDEY